MTDAHCHVSGGEPGVRELIIGRDFVGIHPWETLAADFDAQARLAEVEARLTANPALGVGEIGLDRMKTREIPEVMRTVFARQLEMAIRLNRPLVLHGAKCWGQVVEAVRREKNTRGMLFHGFSRSGGLIPDIVALGGYISVGPAILNDHAVNYRELVKRIPRERLLIETDRDTALAAGEVAIGEVAEGKGAPTLGEVAEGVAKVLGVTVAELEALTDDNAARFYYV